jgi:hypothetical protein
MGKHLTNFNKLKHIFDIAIECAAYFFQGVERNSFVSSQFGNSVRTYASGIAQLGFIHILINKQFPKPRVAYRHKITSKAFL